MRFLLQVRPYISLFVHWFMLFLYEYSCLSCYVDTLDRTVGERRHVVTVELSVRPVDILSSGGSCELAFTQKLGEQLPPEMKEAVENGAHGAFLQGITKRNSCFSLAKTCPALLCCPIVLLFSKPASTFRSIARLSFAGCVRTDPKCQH